MLVNSYSGAKVTLGENGFPAEWPCVSAGARTVPVPFSFKVGKRRKIVKQKRGRVVDIQSCLAVPLFSVFLEIFSNDGKLW